MKENFKGWILPILLSVILFFVFLNYHTNKVSKLKEEISYLKENKIMEFVHDTIFIDKPFEVPVPMKTVEVPQLVTNYKANNTIPIPKEDSLYAFTLKNGQLELSIYKDSLFSKELFNINLDKYNYTYSDGQLTRNRNWFGRINPYISTRIRPFNTMFDISAGFQLKTNKVNYKLGIGSFYYPKIKNRPGVDLELQIEYNF